MKKSALVRTRMAPSPTGEFHIGGMRTLLYNWAFAKANGGKFIIRIEDTDRARLVEGATERLLKVIKDYGFSWDEGPAVDGPFAPYIQSERLDIYKSHAEELIKKGSAYYCFCTPERLSQMREDQKSKGIASSKYDRHCLSLFPAQVQENLKNNIAYVIRLKVPEDKVIKWQDGVLGEVAFNSNEIDDQILIKSDGFPTYHLGVVVDDHIMGITHVMRGNEWLPSTPKHILLYEAFGWSIPQHFHLPNLKEKGSTKKLSKRHGPVSAQGFLDEGYLAEALDNYLMFLGWNPGTDKEIYSLDEFIKDFTLDKIHKTDLVAFDRDKLDWYNGYYIRQKTDEQLAKLMEKFLPSAPKEKLIEIAPLIKDRIKKLAEVPSYAKFFFERPKVDISLLGKNYESHLKLAIKVLESIEDFSNVLAVNEKLLASTKAEGFKTGEFFMDLRVALTGSKYTPPITESMVILGKQESLQRLKAI